MEAEVTFVGPGSVLLKLQVKDTWDVQNFEYDVTSGLFQTRLVSWLREDDVLIEGGYVRVEITDIREGGTDSEPGELFIQLIEVYREKC